MSALQTSSFNLRPNLGSPQFRAKTLRKQTNRTRSQASKFPNFGTAVLHRAVEEEATLLQQALTGDYPAQEQIFARHATMLQRVAFRVLRNKEDAEDAVQDGLYRACARLRSFEGRCSFSTWLTKIVINSALMIRRTKMAHPEASLDEILDNQADRLKHEIVDARPNPEEICTTIEIHERVEEQMRRLPPGLRTAFQLFDLDGLSAAESIQVLGIRKNAFKSRTSRARRKLVNALRQSFQRPANRVPAAGAI